jgi:hypothetical protein
MKIHFPFPAQPDNPRLYVPHEIAVILVSPDHVFPHYADVDYYLIDSTFRLGQRPYSPVWDKLVVKSSEYLSEEAYEVDPAILQNLISQGNVVLTAFNETKLAVWTNTGKFTIGVSPNSHEFNYHEGLASKVDSSAKRYDEINPGDWFKLQNILLVKTGLTSCAGGGASETFSRFWLPATTMVTPDQQCNFALVPGPKALFEDLKIGDTFLYTDLPFVKVHPHAGQPGRELIPSINPIPFKGIELVIRAEVPWTSRAFLFREPASVSLPAPPAEVIVNMASLPSLTPDMISTQAARDEQLGIQMDAIIENAGLKNETATPMFKMPRYGTYYVRVAYSELGDLPNPELTHYILAYDETHLAMYRLIPGRHPEFVQDPPVSPLEILANRRDHTQEQMDADHEALNEEIKATVRAIVSPHGITLPGEFRFPVTILPGELTDVNPNAWYYMHVESAGPNDRKLTLYQVTEEGPIGVWPTGDDSGKPLRDAKYARFLNSIFDAGDRDHALKVSEVIRRFLDKWDGSICLFDQLAVGERFRKIFDMQVLYRKTFAEHAVNHDYPAESWHVPAAAVVVRESVPAAEGLDQTVDSRQNDLDRLVDDFEGLKVETPDLLPEPEHYLMLIEHPASDQRIRIVGTRTTDQRLHFLVQRMFPNGWFLAKYSEIEQAAVDIFREVGEVIYELGKDYSNEGPN